jgi:DNA-binding response OmpR family regulator
MDPVDGLDLLKWVRGHPHDNVRFLPFIMLTAAPELHRVRSARDAGVTAFLRKPVTVDSVISRLREVIERPRPFIRTETYFGPDRRHQQLPFDGPERRQLQATIVTR